MNAIVPVTARFDPFGSAPVVPMVAGMTLEQMVKAAPNLPAAFVHHGEILVDGDVCPRETWPFWRPGPGKEVTLQLLPGEGDKAKNIALVVATIAVIAGTAFIGAGGIATLAGLSQAGIFGAGQIGAQVAAGLFGAAGAFAIRSFAPPPASPKPRDTRSPQGLSSAGTRANALKIGDEVPAIVGTYRYPPPAAIFPYTSYKDGVMSAHCIYQLKGEYLDEDYEINEVPIALHPLVQIQTRPGRPGDPPLTLNAETVIEQGVNLSLSNYVLEGDDQKSRQLIHQSDPDRDLPQWQTFITAGTADKATIRTVFGGGIYAFTDDQAVVPIRMEFRPRGAPTWNQGPTVLVQGRQQGKPIIAKFDLIWDIATTFNAFDTHRECWAAHWRTAPGESFEYRSHDYFYQGLQAPVDGATLFPTGAFSYLPIFAGPTAVHPTLGTTCSITASSQLGGSEAWHVAEYTTASFSWVAAAAVTAATLEFDFGAGAAVEIRGYRLAAQQVAISRKCRDWTFEGQVDGSGTWVVLDTRTGWNDGNAFYSAGIPQANWGKYRKYRLNMTANAGGSQLALDGVGLNRDVISDAGSTAAETSPTYYARQVNLTNDGAELYLDPTVFPKGEYEVRIKRGAAFRLVDFFANTYNYNGATANAYFFDHQIVNFVHAAPTAQYNITSECAVQVFQTTSADHPLNVYNDGVFLVSVVAPNLQINTFTGKFTSILPVYQGGTWSTRAPTRNPAAAFRYYAMSNENPKALPGEIVDEDSMIQLWQRCVDAGFECNGVLEGVSGKQGLQQIAAAAWGTPIEGPKWSVMQERDRRNDPIQQLFTLRNCKSYGHVIDFPDPVHAIRGEFRNEAKDYKPDEVIAYAPGYDQQSAINIMAIPYPMFTSAARVLARAQMDIGQMIYRNVNSELLVGAEGMMSRVGDLVGCSDDALDHRYGSCLVEQVLVDDLVTPTQILGLKLETKIDFGALVGEIEDHFGCLLRGMDGGFLEREVVEQTVTDTITFATPIAFDPLFRAGCLASFGMLGKEAHRKRIFEIKREKGNRFRLILKPDASELIHA